MSKRVFPSRSHSLGREASPGLAGGRTWEHLEKVAHRRGLAQTAEYCAAGPIWQTWYSHHNRLLHGTEAAAFTFLRKILSSLFTAFAFIP